MVDNSPNLSVAERIDSICDQFERDFRAGHRPVLEACLAPVAGVARPALLRALLELELELRQKAGETPQAAEYEARFPSATETIRTVFEAVKRAPTLMSSVKITGIETSQGPIPKAVTAGAASQAAPLQKLGRFEIKSVLGEGAFGTVYRARDPQLDRDVALKVPRFAGQQSREDRERFLREARAAAGLHHAHICPVHEVGTIDGRDYIVLAYIDGKPLSKILQTQPKLSDRQLITVIRKLALALQEAHEKGIIHRDLKPANIMINRKGEPVIMDFGLARREHSGDAQISHSGQIMGTPAYMSPEQARGDGKAVGAATDIYSLGIVLYELICGRRPFDGTVTEVIGKILHVDPPPPSQFRPDVDPQLQAICLQAIAKKPADRFASMKEFATALIGYARALPTGERPAATPAAETGKEPPTNQFADLLAAISSDVESKVERAVSKAGRVHLIPWWTYLVGSTVMGLVVLLGIFFFIRKDTVTVIVNIPIENINDPSLSFLLDDKPIAATAFASPIELKPGKHELVVNQKGKLIKRFVFDVGAKQTDPVVVQDVTPEVPLSLPEDGFVSLFNGKDLTGWTTESNDTENWKVQDGAMAGIADEGPPRPGAETWLLSNNEYQDFVLRFEFRTMTETVNSGFGYRAVPREKPSVGTETYAVPSHLQVEIFDSAANGENQKLKTGTVLGSLRPQLVIPANPRDAQKPGTEWNRMEVEARGQSIHIRLNGTELVNGSLDDLIAQGATYPGLKRKSGRIAFQRLRGTIQFRDIQIKEVKPTDVGWIELFNGQDLTGWKAVGAPKWSWSDNRLMGTAAPSGGPGFLVTESDFENYELELQYRLNAGMGSGLFLRADPNGAESGAGQLEVQIADDEAFQLQPLVATGAVYNVFPRNVTPQFSRGDWNTLRIRLNQRQLDVFVNGFQTVNANLDTVRDKFGAVPGLNRKLGRIALQQNQKSDVEFRNIRIRPIGTTIVSSNNIPADAKTFNGHAYKFFPEQLSWKTAKARCEALGGHLVFIETLAENTFVAKLITDGGKVDSWIGATDEGSEGQWRWVDGRNMTWTNWFTRQKQPNNKGGVEHFGVMSNQERPVNGLINWEWSDQPNESTQHQPGYVCEWDTIPVSTISKADDPDRKAAEFLLSLGSGFVKVNGQSRQIRQVTGLPTEPFRLTGAYFAEVKALDDNGLAVLKDCVHLTELDLRSTRVTEKGLEIFRGKTNFTSLGLAYLRITDTGLEIFQENKRLKALFLHDTYMTDKGLSLFHDCKELDTLWVGGTPITDAGMLPLRECKFLKWLDVRATKVTREGVQTMKAALPACRVDADPNKR